MKPPGWWLALPLCPPAADAAPAANPDADPAFACAADHNELAALRAGAPMPRLRILRASGNRLHELDAAPFPNLRTLYADGNCLGPIHKAHRLTRLENLSLRNQGGRAGL